MGKKAKKRERAEKSPGLAEARQPGGRKPRFLFVIGDADNRYTEGKVWRLAQRLKEQTGANVVALSHDRESLGEAKKLHLETQLIPIESPGVSVEERLRATDEMIRETADINIPGSRLPLWKVTAMDDFLGSLLLFGAQPTDPLDADAVVVPLMCIDNNTKASCGLYTWAVAEARRKGIPIVGLEISPLGNKNTLSQLPMDHYAVKSAWAKDFLVRQKLARAEQVSVLRWEESYHTWSGKDDFTDAFLDLEKTARGMIDIPQDRFLILIPHHVAFFWEVRNILAALAQLDFPFSVVIRVEAKTMRRQYPERELVMEAYGKELRALPHVLIDERVGVGLLLQLADLVITPFAGTATERAALCRKPTIICQALGEEGGQGEHLYWEPRPEKIPAIIQSWKQSGLVGRPRLAQLVQRLINQTAQAAA